MRRLALWTAYALIGFIAVCYSLSFAADRTNRQSEVVSSGASVFGSGRNTGELLGRPMSPITINIALLEQVTTG